MEPYLGFLRVGGYPETTIDTRRQHLHFLARRIDVDPQDVTAEVLEDWCGKQKWEPETRRGRNNTFRFFWRWAESRGLLENVAIGLPSVRQRHKAARVAPYDVYLDALRRSDPRTQIILRLAAECGLRRGEIAVVHPRHDLVQDLLGWSLIVHGKGDKDRVVPLPSGLAALLLDVGDGFLLPGESKGHLSPAWVGRLASRALEGEWTLHTLRALFATRTYDIDHDLFAVQELLGHSSSDTTRRYVRTESLRLRRLVNIAAGQIVPLPDVPSTTREALVIEQQVLP